MSKIRTVAQRHIQTAVAKSPAKSLNSNFNPYSPNRSNKPLSTSILNSPNTSAVITLANLKYRLSGTPLSSKPVKKRIQRRASMITHSTRSKENASKQSKLPKPLFVSRLAIDQNSTPPVQVTRESMREKYPSCSFKFSIDSSHKTNHKLVHSSSDTTYLLRRNRPSSPFSIGDSSNRIQFTVTETPKMQNRGSQPILRYNF